MISDVINDGPSVHQTTHRVLRKDLREGLLVAVVAESGPGTAGGLGSVMCRAAAALYALLLEHPVDRRGRCSSCRRPGAVVGRRRRRCRIYRVAHYWLLHQPRTALLVASLASELGLRVVLPPGAGERRDWPSLIITDRDSADRDADRDDTEVLPQAEAASTGSQHQNPAVSPSPPSPGGDVLAAGQPESDHGGAGDHPGYPWPHHDPPDDDPPAGSGTSVLVVGGARCLV